MMTTVRNVFRPLILRPRLNKATDDPGAWAYTHRWTLSRPLWEASSAFEFDRLWKETPQFIISNYSFDNFLKHGRGEDVDDFAEILMTVSVGSTLQPLESKLLT